MNKIDTEGMMIIVKVGLFIDPLSPKRKEKNPNFFLMKKIS